MILFVNMVIMFSTSLSTFCFIGYQTLLVCCIQILYRMFLSLTRVVHLSFPLIFWSWNLLFCCIDESHKAWKIFFNLFCGVFNLLVMLSIFCISLQMLLWSRSKSKPVRV